MRRRTPFRRRFFRRPTLWTQGVTWTWRQSIYPLEEVYNAAGQLICHTARIPFIPLLPDAVELGDRWTLLRVVGHFWPVVTEEVENIDYIAKEGAQLRCSMERTRIYQQTQSADALAAGGTVGTQEKSHLFGSSIELGDEEIMWTRQYYQWCRYGQSADMRFLPGDAFAWPQSNIEGQFTLTGDRYTDQLPTRVDDLQGRQYDIDIKCRRRVEQENAPFLYVDATAFDGQVLPQGRFWNLRINGFLRLLARKGR